MAKAFKNISSIRIVQFVMNNLKIHSLIWLLLLKQLMATIHLSFCASWNLSSKKVWNNEMRATPEYWCYCQAVYWLVLLIQLNLYRWVMPSFGMYVAIIWAKTFNMSMCPVCILLHEKNPTSFMVSRWGKSRKSSIVHRKIRQNSPTSQRKIVKFVHRSCEKNFVSFINRSQEKLQNSAITNQ